MPRLDAQPGEPLIPIEGTPPDLRRAPIGCAFASRCAWRLDRCWTETPPLEPIDPVGDIVTTGPNATHRAACWNPATAEEGLAAHPIRAGFTPAAPPAEALS